MQPQLSSLVRKVGTILAASFLLLASTAWPADKERSDMDEGSWLTQFNVLAARSSTPNCGRAIKAKTSLSTPSCWRLSLFLVVGTIRLIGSNANSVLSQCGEFSPVVAAENRTF
jgi:hypothetical protein